MTLTDYQRLDNPLIEEKRVTYDAGGWVRVLLVLDVGSYVGGQCHIVYGDIVEWDWCGRTSIDTIGPEESKRRNWVLKGLKENGIDGYVEFV